MNDYKKAKKKIISKYWDEIEKKTGHKISCQCSALQTCLERGFDLGADWQKQQMIKDAIDATIVSDLDPHGADYGNQKIEIEWGVLEAKKLKSGSKVKLIIIENDGKI
jgi:hypothetical protein